MFNSPAQHTILKIILLIACVSPLSAQQAPLDSVNTVLSKAQSGNWHVRVATADSAITGRVLRLEGRTRVGETVVVPTEITRIERRLRQGGGTLRGALVGGAIGAVLMTGLEGVTDNPGGGGAWIAGALLGALPGALVGAAVAPSVEVWQTIYAR